MLSKGRQMQIDPHCHPYVLSRIPLCCREHCTIICILDNKGQKHTQPPLINQPANQPTNQLTTKPNNQPTRQKTLVSKERPAPLQHHTLQPVALLETAQLYGLHSSSQECAAYSLLSFLYLTFHSSHGSISSVFYADPQSYRKENTL